MSSLAPVGNRRPRIKDREPLLGENLVQELGQALILLVIVQNEKDGKIGGMP